MKLKKYIGDRAFYRHVLSISVPIMLQNAITNFVSLLDNIMVGSVSTEAMTGISIVNQFVFIFYLVTFGALSAAGIFTAQFYGKADDDGIRYTLRFKLMLTVGIGILGMVIFYVFGDGFINLFLNASETSDELDPALTFAHGREYLNIILIGLLPYVIAQAYSSTLRETGYTLSPMVASVTAVITNALFNYLLIFGPGPIPALGARGAAIATVISRFVELAVVIVWVYTHKKSFSYVRGLLSSLRIPLSLTRQIVVRGLPLMLNEFLWSIAIMLRSQSYSTRGVDVVAAQNIETTLLNLFNCIYLALGSSIAIIVGKELGTGNIEKAKDTDRKMIAFSVVASTVVSLLFIVSSVFYPNIYNTSEHIKELSVYMMIVAAVTMPCFAFTNAVYFTLRSGGRVGITMLFDCGFMWGVMIPTCMILAHFTSVNIYVMFAICQGIELLKCVTGTVLLKRVHWARRLVPEN
jgi:putative MATE family efflux protein